MDSNQKVKLQGYQHNISRLQLFYHSDFYQDLKKQFPNYVNKVEEALYQDSDLGDRTLYSALSIKYGLPIAKKGSGYCLVDTIGKNKIRLGADIICGGKCLKKYYPAFEDWIRAYEMVRSKVSLHFLWPRHKLPTINTLRHSVYGDRIDLTLFDLKEHFAGEKTLLSSAYEKELTGLWLSQFQHSFPAFIDRFQLNCFVDEEYNVLDITSKQTKIIERIPDRKTLAASVPVYMDSLMSLIRRGYFN